MAGGGPGLPRRQTTDVRSALSPRSDMQVSFPEPFSWFLWPDFNRRCTLSLCSFNHETFFQHKMHNVVDYVLGAPGAGPKVAGIENNIAR